MCHDVATCTTISSAIGTGSVLTSAAIASTCFFAAQQKHQNKKRKTHLQFIAEQEEHFKLCVVQASWKIHEEWIVC
jgi:hypothetical protein